jgi:hypothetical protein
MWVLGFGLPERESMAAREKIFGIEEMVRDVHGRSWRGSKYKSIRCQMASSFP